MALAGDKPLTKTFLEALGLPTARWSEGPDWRGLDRSTKCPQCKQQMDTHLYGGPGNVIIDVCEACGLVWLDHGELERIVSAPDPSPVPE